MPRPSDFTLRLFRILDTVGPGLAMVAVWVLFAIAGRDSSFATWANTQTILLQTAVIGIAALGMTLIIISGGIDLSAGSLIALVSIVVALVLKHALSDVESEAAWQSDLAAAAAAAAGIAVAGLCGLVIGTIVIGRIGRVAALLAGALVGYFAWRLGVDYRASGVMGVASAAAAWIVEKKLHIVVPLSPFIVTLGMWGALRGAAKGLANNSTVYVTDTRLNDFMKLPMANADWSLLARPWQWWSPGVWVFLVLAVLVGAMLRYTQFGRHVYAIGSNEQTARLCGIHVERTKLKIYTIALLLVGVAGVMQFSFVTVGDPTTAFGYELRVIAAVVIGGASLSGGVGGVLGTLAGALLISIIDNGCTMMEYEVWVQEIVTGGIIVAAVTMDKLRAQRAAL